MTECAVFRRRLMLPKEWAALVGMAGVAGLVDGVLGQIALARGAVRVVASGTAHFAFADWMTERLGQAGALILVAGQADVGLQNFVEYRILRDVGGVATDACDIFGLVTAALPMHQLLAVVAALTLGDTDAGVLLLEGDVGRQRIVVDVRLARAVAGGAGVIGHRGAAVRNHAMFGHEDRQHRVLRLLIVAADAFSVSGIVGTHSGSRCAGGPNHPGAEQQDDSCQQRTSGLLPERPHISSFYLCNPKNLENLASTLLNVGGIWPVFLVLSYKNFDWAVAAFGELLRPDEVATSHHDLSVYRDSHGTNVPRPNPDVALG